MGMHKVSPSSGVWGHAPTEIFFVLVMNYSPHYYYQLRAYAKYGSPENVEREIATPSHAICENRLKNRYYAETESSNSFKVHIVLLLLPFLPLMFIALVGSIIRSVNRKIHSKLVDPKNYSSTAGIVLTGMFLSFFIFSCDILAVYYATSGKHEYDEDHVSNSLNILIIWVIFGLDLIVCIIPLTVLLYICYEHVNEEHVNEEHVSEVSVKNYRCKLLKNYVFPFIFEAYVNAVFGDQEQFCKTEKTENKAEAQNTDMLWRVSCAAIAPLFMIPSHIIFILAAWLTDPPRASSIALVAIGIFLYFFLLFRQCYTINKNFKTKCHCWSLFLPLYPIWAFFKFVYIIFCSKICRKVKEKRVECRKKKDCEEGTKEESRLLLEASRKLDETKHFGEKDGGNLKSPVAGNEQNKENGEEGESSNGKEGESSNGKEGESSNGKEGESSNGKEGESSNGKEGESSNGKVGESSKSDTLFNTKAFCIAFAWGWVFLGCLTLFFSALMELPISVFGLPSYLLNIFQVLIVVISMLITYKILSGEAPDMHKFMISAQFAYNEKTKGTKDEDEIEAGGSMFGELAGVVVQKYNQKP